MESLSRLLVFIIYAAAGCLVGAVAWLGGLYYGVSAADPDAEARQAAELSGEGETGVFGRPTPGVHVDYLFAQRGQIEQLQKLLAEKTALLEKKNRLLEAKTLEQRALEAELDETIGLLEVMAPELALQNENGGRDRRLLEDLERLREERNKSAALAQVLWGELEQLRAQLVANDSEIQHLQQQSELETTVLLAEMQTFQGVASRAMAGLGIDAVPALVELLNDPRPRIRRWAAEVLGDIGPPAHEAVPALVDALSDREPQVQVAVREALDQIQPAER